MAFAGVAALAAQRSAEVSGYVVLRQPPRVSPGEPTGARSWQLLGFPQVDSWLIVFVVGRGYGAGVTGYRTDGWVVPRRIFGWSGLS
jgi:hypothetical protein